MTGRIWLINLLATMVVNNFSPPSNRSITLEQPLNTTVVNYSVSYLDYEVSNFTNFPKLFHNYTIGARTFLDVSIIIEYSMSSVPQPTFPVVFEIRTSVDGGAQSTIFTSFFSITGTTSSNAAQRAETISITDPIVLDKIINEAGRGDLIGRLGLINTAAWAGVNVDITNFQIEWQFQFLYDTIYLFTTFLADVQSRLITTTGYTTITSLLSQIGVLFIYSNTITNTTFYRINNDDVSGSIGGTRKKYALSVPNAQFAGNQIGIKFRSNYSNGLIRRTISGSSVSYIGDTLRLYYLNASSPQLPISNVPVLTATYIDCGGLLSLNVGCYLNNALAWVLNDAPLISDAIPIVNGGMNFIGQGLGFVGSFVSGTNLITWLIVAGSGIIIVGWILKNDD
jgi:hypothetical protein